MPYTLAIRDNFHFRDPGATSTPGFQYETAEQAIAAARAIVDEYLEAALRPGISADALFASYREFGEDPAIVSIGAPGIAFSAWDYGRQRSKALCGMGAADE